jgi:hypothetical protein
LDGSCNEGVCDPQTNKCAGTVPPAAGESEETADGSGEGEPAGGAGEGTGGEMQAASVASLVTKIKRKMGAVLPGFFKQGGGELFVVTADNKLYRSNNMGLWWNEIAPPTGEKMNTIAEFNGWLYIGTDKAVWKYNDSSKDGSDVWVSTNLKNKNLSALFKFKDKFYAAAGDTLFRLDATGWINSGIHVPGDDISAMFEYMLELYVKGKDTLYKIKNDEPVKLFDQYNTLAQLKISTLINKDKDYFAGSTGGLFHAIQKEGEPLEWQEYSAPVIKDKPVHILCLAGEKVFAGTDAGLFLLDGSKNWVAVKNSVNGASPAVVSIAYLEE